MQMYIFNIIKLDIFFNNSLFVLFWVKNWYEFFGENMKKCFKNITCLFCSVLFEFCSRWILTKLNNKKPMQACYFLMNFVKIKLWNLAHEKVFTIIIIIIIADSSASSRTSISNFSWKQIKFRIFGPKFLLADHFQAWIYQF